MPDARVHELYADEDLPRLTAETVPNRAALMRQLATIREQGYAINKEESERGLTAISARVRGGTPQLDLAVSVAVPSVRADSLLVKRVRELVLDVVEPGG
ncbi:hypothetical protein MOQ72_28800 [Saccharopolyspora sp. K220]|uniref:IclR family transcriptional regulator domain-containing protein n=1 Tax=Saccharopolyspora soli TaxID=2926618 RepID=UPI001F571589|nr:IclR family transcriptional regulator C-terminal domain-containing protein [Saccharopolyspora soli]MCI2421440.1 hypothetical protein [Saccharopolyspora soli]